ncbi:MAG: AFG1 family ATPase [Nevskiaceae bacterium]|nr:AFG1 family ATPase [Nevskiaceae bacterium]
MLRAWLAAQASGELQPDEGQRAAVQALDKLQVRLRNARQRGGALQRLLSRVTHRPPTTPRGLYLWGDVGRGKTWMMDRFHASLGDASLRLHFQHFMREVHHRLRALRERESPLDAVAEQWAEQTRVLCLDELQVLDIGDAMLLHGLITGLLTRGVTLVTTSNTPPSRLYEGGLQRERFLPAIALLESHLDVIHIGAGPDWRLRGLSDAKTWFDAAQPQTTAQMTALFERLAAGSASPGPQTLQVEGRTLPARRTASGMAWFDFAALCEGPRSAADYIALAEELHTLFLSDVPVFDAQHDDAARRFISLVDELYDRRVKLVLSAWASQLYRGERLRAAFERTASRLVEMRSAQYLARAHQVA